MRLPLSLSERSVIKSGVRILIPLVGLTLVLWSLYAVSGVLERILTAGKKTDSPRQGELTDTARDRAGESPQAFAERLSRELNLYPDGPSPGSEDLELLPERPVWQFPHKTTLESSDGRTLKVELLSRPSHEEIVFLRMRDGIRFRIGLSRLSLNSQELIREFPHQAFGATALPSRAFGSGLTPTYTRAGISYHFPHNCRITNRSGIALDVTLIARPDLHHVTFRRRQDQRIFTISLDRLHETDQNFIRLFPSK